jgi:excisionase family DNA binding protein
VSMAAAPANDRMLSAKEVAEVLGVHEDTVFGWAASGDIRSYKLGRVRRFRQSDLDAWIDARVS